MVAPFFNLFFYWKIIALQNFVFSVKPQHESALGTHMFPPFWISLPTPSPSHPDGCYFKKLFFKQLSIK